MGGGGLTWRETARVWTAPLVWFVKTRLSEYVPIARRLAAVLIVAVTVVEAPACSVPLDGETSSHASAWETVQSNAEELVFVSSYSVLAGVNGPPIVPLGLKEVDGRMTRSDVLSGV